MIASANGRRKHRNVESALDQMSKMYDGARADYQATKKGRFNKRRRNLPSMGGSADYHIRDAYQYYNLIEDCYDLERNDSVVGQLVDRRSANVVQDGFRLEPNTGDKKLNTDIKQRWKFFAEDADQCDIAGEATFHDYEYAADWTHILAGDCGITVTNEGPLQFFEPYQIRRDNEGDLYETFLGVDKDDDGVHVRYWIAEEDDNPYSTTFEGFDSIDTRDDRGLRQFFHIYNQKRMSLTRGVTAFAPIFELTGMLEDVNFAKLVQQQIVSCIAYLIEDVGTGSSALPSTTRNYGGARSEPSTTQTGATRYYDEVAPGMQVETPAGKKITGFSPQVPNPEYFQQYRLILQLICGNLDLPLAIGMLDGSETNFHGFIGAINESKKLWKKSQRRLIKRFHRPCYRAKLQHFCVEDRALRQARKRLGVRFWDHVWHPPVWQSVKPLDDTQDRLMRLRNAIVSPSRMQAELNVDYEDHVHETVRDNALAIRVAKKEAIEINTDPKLQDGQPVHWQQLWPMPTPDGIQATTEIVKQSEEQVSEDGRELVES